jgi:peptidoglycan/xylan/chitin deacetylase (PgdA/CDA1 family)
VTPAASDRWGPWEYAVTPSQLDNQLATLRSAYDIRALSDILTAVMAGDPPTEPTAAITFDDGFRDTLTNAVPILERHGVPATVYVATEFLDGPPPYEYRLAAALEAATHLEVTVGDLNVDRQLHDEQSHKEAYATLRQATKFASPAMRQTLLEAVSAPATCDCAMLTTDELQTLADHQHIEIGGHSHEHVPLTALDADSQRSTIRRCKERLEEILDEPVTLFSYPYGDRSPAVERAVETAAFDSAVTTKPVRCTADTIRKKPFAIPRLPGESMPL